MDSSMVDSVFDESIDNYSPVPVAVSACTSLAIDNCLVSQTLPNELKRIETENQGRRESSTQEGYDCCQSSPEEGCSSCIQA